jgi:curved DNA-binding protein CbpA
MAAQPDEFESDWYRVLQVDPGAERGVVEAAYHRLAARYHPDVDPSPRAHVRMSELNAAWAILRDPGRRADYDLRRRPWDVLPRAVAQTGHQPRMRLSLPPGGVLDFGDERQRRPNNQIWFSIANEGLVSLRGEVRCQAEWLTVRPASFLLAPGQRLTLAAQLLPLRVRESVQARTVLQVVTNGGTVGIQALARVDVAASLKCILFALLAVFVVFGLIMHTVVLW